MEEVVEEVVVEEVVVEEVVVLEAEIDATPRHSAVSSVDQAPHLSQE